MFRVGILFINSRSRASSINHKTRAPALENNIFNMFFGFQMSSKFINLSDNNECDLINFIEAFEAIDGATLLPKQRR